MILYEVFDANNVAAQDLQGFFENWPQPPTPERHHQILANSYLALIAREEETNRIVGFINAISDGVFSCYIPLLEVIPEYRNQDIGKTLVSRLLERLDKFYMIDLCCDTNLRAYYEALGFYPVQGMIWRGSSPHAEDAS